jgi:glycosyltransferase involved in cell wall biosynthesis
MDISIVIPVLNEVRYIESLVVHLISDMDDLAVEVLICDGGSTDGTQDKVMELSKRYPKVKLLNNPQRYVSFAFNNAYTVAQGKYIGLLGAHALYPKDFLKFAFTALESNDCDVVGGPLIQKGKTDTGKAIAYAMSSKFGVGGTEFRTEKKRMYVDSVAFAIYRKEIFEKAGLLDTELIRNQDDELHYRLNKFGYRILMIPEMTCEYYVRDSLKALWKQYFGYGYYKPLVLKKVKGAVRIRHLVPAAFVLYLVSLPLALISILWCIPVLIYAIIIVGITFQSNLSYTSKMYLPLVFIILHCAYGLGFIKGLLKYLST